MNGEFTLLGECILIAIAILYSTTALTISRRIPYPASVAAYGTAVAIWVAILLLSDANLHRVDRVVGIVGVGLLLVHVAYMVFFCGIFLTVVLATNQWA